ncbi:MAG: phosphopyruvate hydratase [Candidatus Levybacteria bacterium RIFCSPLOWO2_01_FULL_38_13]|nr:MAG: phosphopyruvate hydratase [Candidatus Levybacteria bacterium RIFCSPHIGHO2_01_FULL_41_15]OGH35319.1 MAG: phosphopyruvate hydratase [Candidatus Levybacteria bacterium RIFCSPLOWO2_01_FULL_38_13]
MSKIKSITAREILNSKGIPTVEAIVTLSNGVVASASVPGRTSVGGFEAAEITDGDPQRFNGKGVKKVVSNVVDIISPKLIGLESDKQQEIDRIMIELDGTQNKSRLGVNSILPVSMAIAKASARNYLLPLFAYLKEHINKQNLALKIPTPCFNIFNGGRIAGGNLDFQSFLLIPATSKGYPEALQIGVNTYSLIKSALEFKNLPTLIGDEGGFGPSLPSNEDGFNILKQTIENTSLRLGFDVFLGLDASANNFYSEKKYKIKDSVMQLTTQDLIDYYSQLDKKFRILYLEDPLYEEDWDGWAELSEKISQNTIIVGDHLTSTNPFRLQTALDKKAISGIVIKPSQVGTVMESLAVIEVARQAGLKIIVSSTSAETTDDFIADFSVAVSADYVKFGAPSRGENVSKYNRLLAINDEIKNLKST